MVAHGRSTWLRHSCETEYRRSFRTSKFDSSMTTYRNNLDFRNSQKRANTGHNREPFTWLEDELDSDSEFSCDEPLENRRPAFVPLHQFKHEVFNKAYRNRLRQVSETAVDSKQETSEDECCQCESTSSLEYIIKPEERSSKTPKRTDNRYSRTEARSRQNGANVYYHRDDSPSSGNRTKSRRRQLPRTPHQNDQQNGGHQGTSTQTSQQHGYSEKTNRGERHNRSMERTGLQHVRSERRTTDRQNIGVERTSQHYGGHERTARGNVRQSERQNGIVEGTSQTCVGNEVTPRRRDRHRTPRGSDGQNKGVARNQISCGTMTDPPDRREVLKQANDRLQRKFCHSSPQRVVRCRTQEADDTEDEADLTPGPLFPYGYEDNEVEVGNKRTFNVRAAKEIYPSALMARKRRQMSRSNKKTSLPASCRPQRCLFGPYAEDYEDDWQTEYDRHFVPYDRDEYLKNVAHARHTNSRPELFFMQRNRPILRSA